MIRLALIAMLAGTPALAAPSCYSLDKMEAWLATEFGETAVGGGISDTGAIIAIYVSRAGTWSIVELGDNGVACVTSFGTSWMGAGSGKPV